ncbi:DnaJ domain-containing protein [Glaciihabitans sp. dw_435]|uniref:J domain-containing protein n=1 Tax=Glaciihabitans sp. dw_435 TaxID=2720081 RepID=UPI001BD62255|nr:DnaJ domain-containing protein [Glaciihabitans sp. dw_435]
MPDSPAPASPYDVLGVSPTSTMDELRRAYRKRLRETHPDTGGLAVEFHAVQLAWQRVGTPEDRASYDNQRTPFEKFRTSYASPEAGAPSAAAAGSSAPGASAGGTFPTGTRAAGATGSATGAPREEARSGSSAPPPPTGSARFPEPEPAPHVNRTGPAPARAYGHPGGWYREQYFLLMREWMGRGSPLDNPFDGAMVRAAPREIRHLLADAVAEEETAKALSTLGITYTLWHDVATDVSEPGPEKKLDHIVLGPSGLFALLSEDWGRPVEIRKGELTGVGLGVGERPVHSLTRRARWISRASKVDFGAYLMVIEDEAYPEPVTLIGKSRGIPILLVRRSALLDLIRTGVSEKAQLTATRIFDYRERLQKTIRFV